MIKFNKIRLNDPQRRYLHVAATQTAVKRGRKPKKELFKISYINERKYIQKHCIHHNSLGMDVGSFSESLTELV